MTDDSFDGADGGAGISRRDVLRKGSLVALGAALPAALPRTSFARPVAKTAASEPIKLGFIALTDCAPIVMAGYLGFFKKAGLNVQLLKQASWPATRDALLNGDIDGAHCLYSMPFSVAAGIGGKGQTALKIAMMLNNNGQAITLENKLSAAGYDDLEAAKKALAGGKGKTLAMTFPGGTHDMWLRYWLLAMGIPLDVPKIIPIPPPQMVANMKVGAMDGYCVGEPWGAVAVRQKIGFTTITTQDIWKHHPEKALVVNEKFAGSRRSDLKKLMGAVLQASKWLDVSANRSKAANILGTPNFVNAKPEEIKERLLGNYALGLVGHKKKVFHDDTMSFYRGGQVPFPRKAYGIWALAQYRRFGYLKSAPDYDKLAKSLILTDLYKEVAHANKVPVPNDDMKPIHIKLDGVTFDPKKPEKEARRK